MHQFLHNDQHSDWSYLQYLYDPVSYFEDHPVVGNSQITSTYEGATYYFATIEHKSQFNADPEHYIPQYEGFCAVAVSEGKLVSVNPETNKVTEGKLYLFYPDSLSPCTRLDRSR